MFFNKRILKALLWKHWIVRKRTWLVSSVELLLPLAMFLGMFALRKEIGFKAQSSSVKSVDTGILRSDPLRLSEAAVPECILFTPDNKLNRDIIVIVAKKLNRVELDDPPDDKEECHGYYIFNHTSEVSNFTESERMRANDAIVVFEAVDFDTSSMPPNMSYTIRMKKPFMTHLDSALDDSLAPHQSFSTIYESFMRLQWAIDTSFIELLTGKEVKQRVTLQEFPFVKSNNDMSAILVLLISCSVLLTMIGPFMFMTGRMALERISGIREIMKMSGASGMLLNCLHLLDYMPMMLMFAISGAILLKVGDPPLLPKSNGFLLFLIFLLHAISLMTFGMIVSYVIRSEQYANMWSLGAYLFICCCLDSATSFIPNEGQPYLALVPLCPMKWVMTEITQLERYGVGATFNTITSAHTITNISICYALWSMFAQIVFYMALAWYLEHVYPGKYGIRLPWNFLCQKQYWRANDVAPGRPSPDEEPMKSRRDKRFFEKPPANAYAGLKAVNVTKIYRSYPALNDVSLQVYRGELTVLLGHNGAGKTTLMSIMTGTINPTSGKLYVNGTDIKTKDVRSHIGFCPQHNLYYPALNVVEHAVLFAMIRGQSKEEAWAKSGPLLEKLGLKAKATALGATLSGGMKRRLQMACALAGDVDVLVLDEPSSGLDVETRRHLWDLLLSLRANRTVLLSTHFMEEADALGDRIAALNAGELKCYGTPMFLKRAVGTGYRLSLTTSGQPDEAAIKSVVQSVVPEATVAQNEVGTIAFALPATSSDRFPQLFAKLEEQKATLGVLSIGVGVTTLEDVFVAVCSDVDTKTNADEVDGMSRSEPKYEKLTGFPLCCSQFAQLLKREALFIYHKKFTFLFLQVLSSVLLLWVIATRFNNENLQSSSDRRRILEAGAYSREATPSGELRVLYRGEDSVLPTLRARYPMVQFESSGDVAETILRIGQNSLMEYHKYLAGLEVNETDAKVMYSTLVRHAAPTALSLLANVLAAAMGPAATLRAAAMPLLPDRPLPHLLLTSVEPVTLTQDRANEPKNLVYSIVVCFFIFFGTLWQSLNAVALPAMSRITGARHLHIAAGCSAELHWLAGLLFRLLVLFAIWFLPLLIIFACDPDDTYNNFTFMWATFWLMVIGSASFITLGYWISLVLSDSYTQLLLFILIIASFLLMIAASFVSWIIYLVPSCTFLAAMIRLGNLAFLNAHFAIAGRDTSYCAICFGEYGIGIHLLWLILYTCMFLGIVFASQRGVWSQMFTRRGRPHELRYGDEAVRREQDYVADTITLETKRIPDAMLVSKIQKQYRKITPVKNISFSVKKGECLGLLGVNGAGKTTTFNMLTAEQWPSLGRLFAGGHHRQGYTLHYMRALGYCPQFFGLDGFLTGKQNLELLLRFRGLGVRDARQEAAAWIRIVGLEKYTNQKVEQYSGGCQRRISAAAALEIGAPLTVLDEPTSGVDVAARRRVWAALRRGLRSQRAVIITSHSMDEMEALCNRIAIMGGGEICALGAPAALRAAHAAGHAVVVKLRPPPPALEAPDQPDGAVPENAELNKLKEKFEKTFNATLKDEHLTMLHYHINETMEYSKLFSEMEKLKKKFPNYVEDYSVAETTLEEVFLGFAKKTADDAQATADALKAKKEAELAARRPKKQTQTDGKNSKKDNGSPKHNV